MITIFNRTVLLCDPSAESASKACSLLRKAGIAYKFQKGGRSSTKPAVRIPRTGRTGNMTSGISGNVYPSGGVPYSWSENNSSSANYTVYVLKKDLEKAKEICDI